MIDIAKAHDLLDHTVAPVARALEAGRPDRWEFRTWSQPRPSDLVAVVATTILLAALFIGLAMG